MWPFFRLGGRAGGGQDADDPRRRVEMLLRTGGWEEAERILRELLAADPRDPWARNKLGAALALAGRRAEAAAILDELIADEPDYAPAWVNRGNMAFEAGDLDEAERHYRKALELDPASPTAHNNLAAVFKRRGDISSMVAHLKRARLEQQRAEQRQARRGFPFGPRRDDT